MKKYVWTHKVYGRIKGQVEGLDPDHRDTELLLRCGLIVPKPESMRKRKVASRA